MKKIYVLAFLLMTALARNSAFALEALPVNECESTAGGCYATSNSDFGQYRYYYSAATTVPSPYAGARTTTGNAPGAVDVWGICRYVDNPNANAYFVPFNSKAEWFDFIANAPNNANVKLDFCARSTSLSTTVQGVSQCSTATVSASLPYARTGTVYQKSSSIGCSAICYTNDTTSDTQCGSSWVNTATVTYTALNSDSYNPSWSQTPTYAYTSPPTVAYPSCDPRAATNGPYTTTCSKTCGSGTQSIYYTDNCGGSRVTGSQSCNTNACATSSRSGGGGGGGGSAPGGYEGADGQMHTAADDNSPTCNCSQVDGTTSQKDAADAAAAADDDDDDDDDGGGGGGDDD